MTIPTGDVIHLDLMGELEPRFDAARTSTLLAALGEQLEDAGLRFELVVIGGSALQALGLVERLTRDVDVVAIRTSSTLVPAEPLPEALSSAVHRVARDFAIRPDWLNAGPADLVRLGLPAGFMDRVESRSFGPNLVVHFASRLDQIHFKLYAMADQRSARHESDLRALVPTPPGNSSRLPDGRGPMTRQRRSAMSS